MATALATIGKSVMGYATSLIVDQNTGLEAHLLCFVWRSVP